MSTILIFKAYFIVVVFPLVLSNSIHMVLVKVGVFKVWEKPIHTHLFGNNKTWRGFVLVPLLNGMITALWIGSFPNDILEPFFFGVLFGLAYMLAELPNSYIKRKLGIQSGEKHPNYPVLFTLMDKSDSAFLVSILYGLVFQKSLFTIFFLFIGSVLIHFLVSCLLVQLQIKKSI